MKKVMIFGDGISGKGAKRLLEKKGYEVILVDDKTGVSSEEAVKLLDSIELFIKSPGTPYNFLLDEVRKNKIEIIDEIELAYRYMKSEKMTAKIVAVTGSNGKTTVTTKITELLNKAGYKAKHAGNIGNSFAELLLDNNDLEYVVLELSSFQLENIKYFKADISIVINLSPDHLNRYDSVDDYYNTKFNITNNQGEADVFIYNENDIESLKRLEIQKNKSRSNKIGVTIDKNKEKAKCYSENNKLICFGEEVLDVDRLALKGAHNLENILFIVVVAKILKIDNNTIREFLYNTVGLEHRMEVFHKWRNVTFINDSKGTNLESTKYAIGAYKGAMLICGGLEKHLPLESLIEIIKSNIKEVYVIGAMADRIEKELIMEGYPKEKINNTKTLKNTIEILAQKLEGSEKEYILLSPATASWDQFKSFEERGEVFKELVRKSFN